MEIVHQTHYHHNRQWAIIQGQWSWMAVAPPPLPPHTFPEKIKPY